MALRLALGFFHLALYAAVDVPLRHSGLSDGLGLRRLSALSTLLLNPGGFPVDGRSGAGLRRGLVQIALGKAVPLEHLLQHVNIGGNIQHIVPIQVIQHFIAGFQHHLQRVLNPLLGGLGLRAVHAALIQGAVGFHHFQGGGQIILHKLANLGRFGGLVIHRAEHLGALVFQLVQADGQRLVGNQIVLRTNFPNHGPALFQNGVHFFHTGLARHFLQAFRRFFRRAQIQALGHGADYRSRKPAQCQGQYVCADGMRVKQHGKQGEHAAKRDDACAQTLGLFGFLAFGHD